MALSTTTRILFYMKQEHGLVLIISLGKSDNPLKGIYETPCLFSEEYIDNYLISGLTPVDKCNVRSMFVSE